MPFGLVGVRRCLIVIALAVVLPTSPCRLGSRKLCRAGFPRRSRFDVDAMQNQHPHVCFRSCWYLALYPTRLHFGNEFANRSPDCFRMVLLEIVDAGTELNEPAVMEFLGEIFSHRG